MSILDELMKANWEFLEKNSNHIVFSKKPKRQIALISCMDTRLVGFLEEALGIKRGDAIIIRMAGTSVGNCISTTLRSLILAIYELDVVEIIVVGHHDCGALQSSRLRLKEMMRSRGIEESSIAQFEQNLLSWLDNLAEVENEVKKLVNALRENPLIPSGVIIHGLVIDPASGELTVLQQGY